MSLSFGLRYEIKQQHQKFPTWSQMTAYIWYLLQIVTVNHEQQKRPHKSDRLTLTVNQDYRTGSLSAQHNLQNHCKIKGLQAASPQRRTPLYVSFFSLVSLHLLVQARILFADFSINLKFKKQNFTASLQEWRQCYSPKQQQQIFPLEISHQVSDDPKRSTRHNFDLINTFSIILRSSSL